MSSKIKNALLAQLVEHLTLNQGVQGSSPWRRTIKHCFCGRMGRGDGAFFVREARIYAGLRAFRARISLVESKKQIVCHSSKMC